MLSFKEELFVPDMVEKLVEFRTCLDIHFSRHFEMPNSGESTAIWEADGERLINTFQSALGTIRRRVRELLDSTDQPQSEDNDHLANFARHQWLVAPLIDISTYALKNRLFAVFHRSLRNACDTLIELITPFKFQKEETQNA